MYDIGDRVTHPDHEGIFIVKSTVKKEDGQVLISIVNAGDSDEEYLVPVNEANPFDMTRGAPEVQIAKLGMTRYVAILPDLREMAFIYDVTSESYKLYVLDLGHSVLDPGWEEDAKLMRTGRSSWEDSWDVFMAVAEKYDADVSGARVPELLEVLEEHQKVAYVDFEKGDPVAFVVGNVWVKGTVVDGWGGHNQSYLVKDDMGITQEVQGSWMVAVHG